MNKAKKYLKELATKMAEQDNRATQDVGFMVIEERLVPTERHNDWDEKERPETIDEENLCDNCIKMFDDGGDLPEDCDDCEYDAFHYLRWVERTSDMAGVFLTSEACDKHIEANRHHYGKNARSYGICFWRNPEMRKVINAIFEISGVKKPGYYSDTKF